MHFRLVYTGMVGVNDAQATGIRSLL